MTDERAERVGVVEPPPAVDPDRPPGKRRPWVFGFGLLLVAGGLGLLGWVGWQMFGTNYVSAKKHESIVADIEKQWRSGGGETIAAAGSTATYVVRIPKFGSDYVVPILEGISDDVLASGYGHFEQSVGAGKVGNFALAAHRVTHGEPLRRMPELEAGDKIIVETRKAIHTYVLDTGGDELTVDFTAGWVIDPLPANPTGGVQPAQEPGQRLITLTTCAELFHTDDRLIAFGHLEKTEPRR
ncbi:MAG: class E sortase [Nocardioides sp.]